MTRYLTSKQVAKALGTSESSVKRWCDQGRIPSTKTCGGHRRLRRDELIQLVRDGEFQLADPEVLDLPRNSGLSQQSLNRSAGLLNRALIGDQPEATRQVLFDAFLAGHSVATIGDEIIATAFHELGAQWKRGEVEVFEERRAVCHVERVLSEFYALIPRRFGSRPVAIGGAPCGDPYSLPTTMVELTLLDKGWRATSLGGPLPWDAFQAAVEHYQPVLFWLSVSHVADRDLFLREYEIFYQNISRQAAVVIGGRAIDSELLARMRYTSHCTALNQLVEFVRPLEKVAGKTPC